jgi:threonine/homoserine/homoserine lactone efflux protein
MLATWVTGTLLGLSAGLAPGPLLALVIAETLRHDIRAGIKVAVAPVITDLPIIVLTVLVLSRLSRSDTLLGVISIAGGILILYLGCQGLRLKGVEIEPAVAKPRSLLKGIAVNAVNPHPYLFWLSVGAPLVVRAWGRSHFEAALFLFSFYGLLVGSKIALALVVEKSKFFLTGKLYRGIMRILGALLLVFAIFLFHDGLQFLGKP